MKTKYGCQLQIERLEAQALVFQGLIDVCRSRGDLHGVVDACNDLRVIEAEIAMLEWVMA